MANSVLSNFISKIVKLWKGLQLSSWSPLKNSNSEKPAFLKPIILDFVVILVIDKKISKDEHLLQSCNNHFLQRCTKKKSADFKKQPQEVYYKKRRP